MKSEKKSREGDTRTRESKQSESHQLPDAEGGLRIPRGLPLLGLFECHPHA